jgi:tetratricopeptide (TPR) repeat protein
MEFFELYGRHLGELIAWLSKPETSVPAIKLIQATAALIGATISVLGFYKAWRYAERRLGKRLDEFLDSQEIKLVAARKKLTEVRGVHPNEVFDISTLLSKRELKTVLKAFGKRFRSPAKYALEEAVTRTSERGHLAQKKEKLHLKEKAVAHLLLGAIADSENQNQAALIHFQSALELDPEDSEALEYAGFQYLKLGSAAEALAAFTKLESLARERRDPLLQAQALTNSGMAFEKLPTPRLRNASIAYGSAIGIFPKDGPQVELARIYERRALVSIELGYRPLAHECLMHALARYAEHERTRKRRRAEQPGTTRILAALKTLEQMNNGVPASDGDGDGPSGPNGASQPQLALSQQQRPDQPPDGVRPN